MSANLKNSAVATGLENVSFHFNPQKGQCQTVKLCSFHMLIKVILKIRQARLQQYMNWELPDIQVGFRKGRGIRDQTATICWIIEKAKEKEMATHSSVLAWRIPGTAEPGGLPSMGSHRVGHDWNDLAAAAAAAEKAREIPEKHLLLLHWLH